MDIDDWKNALKKIVDKNQIDEILDEFVTKHKLNLDRFEANLERLTKTKKSIANFFGIRKLTPTPSINYFNPGRIAPAFPLWFYAAYPDVMQWFHEYQKSFMRNNNYNEDLMALEMVKLFGIDTVGNTITKDKIFDNNGQYRSSMLKGLTGSYVKIEKKEFETSL